MRNIFKQILFAILLLLIQLPSFAEEVTELYLVRNSHLKDVKDISDFYSRQKNLIVKSQDSYSVSYITDREYFVAYFELVPERCMVVVVVEFLACIPVALPVDSFVTLLVVKFAAHVPNPPVLVGRLEMYSSRALLIGRRLDWRSGRRLLVIA